MRKRRPQEGLWPPCGHTAKKGRTSSRLRACGNESVYAGTWVLIYKPEVLTPSPDGSCCFVEDGARPASLGFAGGATQVPWALSAGMRGRRGPLSLSSLHPSLPNSGSRGFAEAESASPLFPLAADPDVVASPLSQDPQESDWPLDYGWCLHHSSPCETTALRGVL